MKISSGRRQEREVLCADSATPALKVITAPKCWFGSQDQQRGGSAVAVLPFRGDPSNSLGGVTLPTPPGISGSQEVSFAIPSLWGTVHSTHTASLACSKKSPPVTAELHGPAPFILPSPFQHKIKLIWRPVPATKDTYLLRVEAGLTVIYALLCLVPCT